MFDPEDPNSHLLLTRVFQALANANTRQIVETLAQRPCGRAELLQVIDSTESRIKEAMKVLQTLRLVAEREAGEVYTLDATGLDLARSWLERIYSIVGEEAVKR
jgi:DNA-binding IclR family transcriptional regulator